MVYISFGQGGGGGEGGVNGVFLSKHNSNIRMKIKFNALLWYVGCFNVQMNLRVGSNQTIACAATLR